jgi:DNA-directed RNA polymerase specialized sigma24 family protein
MTLTARDNSISGRLNRMYADPNRDESAFWELLLRYIIRVANGHAPNRMLREIAQDVAVEVWTCLPRFESNPDHAGTSFSRWVVGVTKRRAWDAARAPHRDRSIPASQLPSEQDFEPTNAQPADIALATLITKEERPAQATAAADAFRSLVRETDLALFDLLRSGVSRAEAARQLGMTHRHATNITLRWQRLARRKGLSWLNLPTPSA